MKTIVLILLLCCSATSFSQNKKRYLYYLNDNLEAVEKAKATIVGKGFVENGQFKLDCFLIGNDNVLITAHYVDSSLSQLEGSYITYHPNGDVAQEGSYKANNKEGVWQSWDMLGLKTDSTLYVKDKPTIKAAFSYNKNGSLSGKRFMDGLADTFEEIVYDDQVNIAQKIEFKGGKGVMTTYSKTGTIVDSLFTRQEMEASFAGGDIGWRRYLEEFLDPDVPVINNAPEGVYQVVIQFIVEKDGTLSDMVPLTNHGYGMEKEVIRILKKCPKWLPASQYGRAVKAYRKQPVTFVVYTKKEIPMRDN